jgi:hypothetical protein
MATNGEGGERKAISVNIPTDLEHWIHEEWKRRALTKQEIVARALAIGLREVAPLTAPRPANESTDA